MTLLSVARRPGNALSFSLWLAMTASGLVLHFLADVFQARHPAFPLLPILICAGTAFFGAHVSMLLLARRSVPGFALYQPFVGGDRYIVMQAIGYLGLVFGAAISSFYFVYFFGVGGTSVRSGGGNDTARAASYSACASSPMCLLLASSPFHYGLLSAGGVISATGTFLLMQSLQSFRNPKFAADGLQRTLLKKLSTPPNRETALVLMVGGANVIVCMIGGTFPALAFLCLAVYFVIHCVCGAVIHFVIGWRHTVGYKLFNPYPPGGLKAAVAQCIGWVLYAVALEGSVLLMRPHAPLVGYIALASIGVLSVMSLLLFVRTASFDDQSAKAAANSSGGVSGDSRSFAAQHGPFVLSVINATVSAFVWAVSAIDIFALFDLDPSLAEGLSVCQHVSAVLMLGLPPLTHLVGSIKFPDCYDAWQPFQGPPEFILLQAIGWAFYTISIVTGIMSISGEPVFLDVYALSVLLSQLFIHSSVSVFHPIRLGQSPSHSRNASPEKGSPNRCADDDHDPSNSPLVAGRIIQAAHGGTILFNGEMITSVMLVVSSVIFRVICDVTPRGTDMPVVVLVASATAMWAIATPLAHISGRDKGIPIFQPFSGPAEYVALQAVGWTLYAIVLLLQVISVFEGTKDFTPLMFTMEGVVAALPFTMIAASVYFGSRVASESSSSSGAKTPPLLRLPDPAIGGSGWSSSKKTQHNDHLASASTPVKSSRQQRTDVSVVPSASDVDELHRLMTGASSTWVAQHLRTLLDEAVYKSQEGPSTASSVHVVGAAAVNAPLSPEAISPAGSSSGTKDPAKNRAYGAACATVFVMCATSTTLFFLAADFSTVDRRKTALILATAGCFCTTMASVGVHLILGPLLNGDAYRAFMPFEGGVAFVALQACGWSAYTVMIVLCLLYAMELTSALAPLLVAGCLGDIAQVLILLSTRRFSRRSTRDDPPTMLENHAEGAVAVLMFLGTFTFFHSYETFAGGKTTVSPFPILCSCTCLVMAIPLTVRSLRKSSESWTAQEQLSSTPLGTPSKWGSSFSGRHEPTPPAPVMSKRRMLVRSVAAPPLMLLEYLIFVALGLLPLAALYFAYYMSNDAVRYAGLVLVSSRLLLPGIAIALLLTLISRSAPQLTPKWFITLRVTVTSCLLYMIPTIIVLPSYVIGPVFYPTNGTILWMVFISWYTVVPPPWNRVLLRPVNAGAIAWFLYTRGIVNLEDPADVQQWIVSVVDLSIVAFWYWYNGPYSGKPEESGARRSPWFIQFMKTWFFDDAVQYFNLRVVADRTMKNKLADPKNKYIFAFHPHGVFPATAMYAPLTEQWRDELGHNSKTLVVGHAATILFNGPLIRDFIMALGARAVTRTGIESSLQEGHSVVIVTGGQSEMILTEHSREEMHLVTHHFGFIKMAVKNKTPLVPMLSLAENNVLDLMHLYRIQRVTLKLFGFPAPLFPIGRWYLPLPNRTPLTVVVGAPIYPEPGLSPEDAEGIERLAKRYFESVKQLFYEHRAAAGYPNMELYLHHGLSRSNPKTTLKRAQSPPAAEPPTASASAKQHQTNVLATKAAPSKKK